MLPGEGEKDGGGKDVGPGGNLAHLVFAKSMGLRWSLILVGWGQRLFFKQLILLALFFYIFIICYVAQLEWP